jgi:hypothetical protein
MFEAEKALSIFCSHIPEKINEMPECPNGTTEQLCHYFLSTIKFVDERVKLLSVSVCENNNRETTLWNRALL